MKKMLLVLGLSLLALIACNDETGNLVNDDDTLVDIGNLSNGYDLIRDTNTGCVYIRENANNADSQPLTPYYGEDGKVVGCGVTELDKSKYE